MDNCIFCKIIEGKIPSSKVFENQKVLGFKDLHPQAAKHFLFIHKEHTKNILEMSQNSEQIVEVFQAIAEFTQSEGMDQKGFRVVTNMGPYGGQTVFHTHFHLLGGEQLGRFGS